MGLSATVSDLYAPLFEGFARKNWGKLSEDHTKEFVTHVKKFGSGLQKALAGLNSGILLAKADPRVLGAIDTTSVGLATVLGNADALKEVEKVLDQWCEDVAARLSPEESSHQQLGGDDGPFSEIENWRNKQAMFNGIMQQLKTQECKVILAVANAAKMPKLKRWRTLDNSVTDAANEAKDNVKYLTALEKYLEPLYVGDTRAAIDGLPGLLNNVKMMHTIARYYNTTEHMTTLFCKITNQCIRNCKEQLVKPGKLWEQPIDSLLKQLRLCLQLNESYQEYAEPAPPHGVVRVFVLFARSGGARSASWITTPGPRFGVVLSRTAWAHARGCSALAS